MWLVSVCVHLNVHKCGLHPLFPLFFFCREKQKQEAERKTVLVVSSPWIMLSLIFSDYMNTRWPSPSESESVSRSVESDCLQTHGLYSSPVSSVHGISQARILEWLPFPSAGDLSYSRIASVCLVSPILARGFFTTAPPGDTLKYLISVFKLWAPSPFHSTARLVRGLHSLQNLGKHLWHSQL